MGSTAKKKRIPTLVDVVFSWSIHDIMNNDLYKNMVNPIQETFPSLRYYLHSFIKPLIEETHADLRSNMTTLPSAPIVEIFQIQEGDKFKAPNNLLYELKLEENEMNKSDVYEPEVGDLIALQVKPKCIDDLQGAKLSFHLALVEGTRVEDTLSSKVILIDNAEFKNSGGGNGGNKLRLFAVYLTNLTTNLWIWTALHSDPGEEGNDGILNSVLRVDPNAIQMEEKCSVCSDRVESGGGAKITELIVSLGLDNAQREAVLKCIALSECKHGNSVKLIWGPPGTGKTKTIASLLYSWLKIKCRTLTCAPTNVAVLGVVNLLKSCLKGYYGLGDVVLFAE